MCILSETCFTTGLALVTGLVHQDEVNRSKRLGIEIEYSLKFIVVYDTNNQEFLPGKGHIRLPNVSFFDVKFLGNGGRDNDRTHVFIIKPPTGDECLLWLCNILFIRHHSHGSLGVVNFIPSRYSQERLLSNCGTKIPRPGGHRIFLSELIFQQPIRKFL